MSHPSMIKKHCYAYKPFQALVILIMLHLYQEYQRNNILVYATVSYSMIVLYSRDHKGVGVAYRLTSPKNQPQFSLMTMRQYWLGKTKLKQV